MGLGHARHQLVPTITCGLKVDDRAATAGHEDVSEFYQAADGEFVKSLLCVFTHSSICAGCPLIFILHAIFFPSSLPLCLLISLYILSHESLFHSAICFSVHHTLCLANCVFSRRSISPALASRSNQPTATTAEFITVDNNELHPHCYTASKKI